MEYEGGLFRRRAVASIEAVIEVSTRRGWSQRTRLELFSPDLDLRLLKIGLAERARVGLDHRIVITATAVHSDSVQTLTWEPGRLAPELTGLQQFDPPFSKPTGFNEWGEPTGFEGDDAPRTLTHGLGISPVDAYAQLLASGAQPDAVDPHELDPAALEERQAARVIVGRVA